VSSAQSCRIPRNQLPRFRQHLPLISIGPPFLFGSIISSARETVRREVNIPFLRHSAVKVSNRKHKKRLTFDSSWSHSNPRAVSAARTSCTSSTPFPSLSAASNNFFSAICPNLREKAKNAFVKPFHQTSVAKT